MELNLEGANDAIERDFDTRKWFDASSFKVKLVVAQKEKIRIRTQVID